jgi:hypothetical protein
MLSDYDMSHTKDYVAVVRIHAPNRNGNTYHDVELRDNTGKLVAKGEKFYGEAYKTTVANLLNERDMLVTMQDKEPEFNLWGYDQVTRHVLFIEV